MDPADLTPTRRERISAALWPDRPRTWRELREWLVPELINIGRLTLATVLGYAASRWALSGAVDLTGALTALLVVQASARGSFSAGAGRVLAVLSGVGLALLFTLGVGLTWWSLGLLIATALVVAKLFRLRGAMLEVPISAMLILGSAGHDVAAESRVWMTLIGTAVGMILPLVLPPAIPTRPAISAVRGVADRLAAVFAQAAEYAERQPITSQVANEWVEDTRRLAQPIDAARRRIRDVRDVRSWNTRAWGQADLAPLLSHGLEALDASVFAARALFHVISNEAPHERAEIGFSADVRQAFAVVLADVGECAEAYGMLLEAEAAGNEAEAQERLAEAVEVVEETRAILTDLMLVSPGEGDAWMMHASVLKALGQILSELDLKRHLGQRDDWHFSQTGLKGPSGIIGPEIHNPVHRWSQRRLVRRASASHTTDADVVAQLRDDSTVSIPVISAPLLTSEEVEAAQSAAAGATALPRPAFPRSAATPTIPGD